MRVLTGFIRAWREQTQIAFSPLPHQVLSPPLSPGGNQARFPSIALLGPHAVGIPETFLQARYVEISSDTPVSRNSYVVTDA